MGLFGGGNKKTYTTTNVIDDRLSGALSNVSGPGVITRGDVTLDLTYTDLGSVESAFAYADEANRNVLDLGKTSLGAADRATARALIFGDAASKRAYDFVEDIQRQATESQRSSTEAVVEGTGSALAAVERANKSEAAQAMDQIIKYGGLAAAGIALVVLFKD